MLTLPTAIIPIVQPFAILFDRRTWINAQVLLFGAVLSPGKRTVTSALRVMGLSTDDGFSRYHHVLNRAVWSPLRVSRVLLELLVGALSTEDSPLIFGIDESLERRKGRRIRAKGIYRDGVRSSRKFFVKAMGLRWISLMLLTPIPWAQRVWALPVMTVLSPSERYYRDKGRVPLKLTDRARQMILQLRRWLPDRYLVLVGDSSYAALDLLHFCQSLPNPVTFITRLRLDAALFQPAPPRKPGQNGRPRLKGKRLPTLQQLVDSFDTAWTSVSVAWYDGKTRIVEITSQSAVWYHSGKPPVPIRWVLIRDPQGELETQALLCTDPTADSVQIIEWFVRRWQVEVTFEEARAHLGVETQRQWSEKAIGRATPVLFGLFSWVTLAAHVLQLEQPLAPRGAAWYSKPLPTFADAIALVRRRLWLGPEGFSMSGGAPDIVKVPMPLFNRFVDALTYAA